MIEVFTSTKQTSVLVPASQGMEVNASVDPSPRRVTIFRNKLCNGAMVVDTANI